MSDDIEMKVPRGTIVKVMGHPVQLVKSVYICVKEAFLDENEVMVEDEDGTPDCKPRGTGSTTKHTNTP